MGLRFALRSKAGKFGSDQFEFTLEHPLRIPFPGEGIRRGTAETRLLETRHEAHGHRGCFDSSSALYPADHIFQMV